MDHLNKKIKINTSMVLLMLAITLIIICCIGIISNTKEINKSTIILEKESNIIHQCYSDKNINNYGKLHKVCNSCKFNNTKYFDIDIKNINIECNKDCPTYDCIKYTKIKIFNNTDVIDFFECFENINKDYFQFECKGIQNCDKKKYNDMKNDIKTNTIRIVVGIIFLIVFLFFSIILILNINSHCRNKTDFYEHL